MSSLSSSSPTLEIVSENFKKTDVVALARLLSIPDLVRSCVGLTFKSNEKKPLKSSVSKNATKAVRRQQGKQQQGKHQGKQQQQQQQPAKGGGKDGKSKKEPATSKDSDADALEVGIVNRPNADLVKTLAKFLRRADNLKTLNVVGVNFAQSDLRIIAKGLCMNKKAKLVSAMRTKETHARHT